MKLAFPLLVMTLLLVACDQDKSSDTTIDFSGTVTGPVGDSIFIFDDDLDVDVAIAIDSAGTFNHTFEADTGYYTLRHGRERTAIYLEPGYSLTMTLDPSQFDESISYEGEGASENNYLAAKYLFQEQNDLPVDQLYKLEEEPFSSHLDKSKSQLDSLLATYETGDYFTKVESQNIEYEILNNAKRYGNYHSYFTKNEDFEPSEEFNARFDNISFDDAEAYTRIPAYRELVRNYIMEDGIDAAFDRLEDIESRVIINDMVAILVPRLSPGMESLDDHVATIKSLTDDEEIIADLEERYNKMKALKRGEDSPGFRYENVEGQMVSLQDLKGQNVYIDVWATWCGPCKAEIPYLKELEAEFHEENIAFVSISVDEPKDKEKWQNMVEEKELKGIQLITDNGWDTEFVTSYLINGIPRFILLDTEGRIVSADAPRPSSDQEIRDMIQSLNLL